MRIALGVFVREDESGDQRAFADLDPDLNVDIGQPEGEMLTQAEERLQASLTKLVKRYRDGVIALVVAEPMASLVRRFLTHEELGDLWKAADRHGQWDVFDVQPDDLVVSSS